MMTADEAKRVLAQAKEDLWSWEVVLNTAHSDEAVREGVLFNLYKMYYTAAGRDGEAMRLPDESFEEAIGRFVFASTDGSYFPLRAELDEVVGAALSQRKRNL